MHGVDIELGVVAAADDLAAARGQIIDQPLRAAMFGQGVDQVHAQRLGGFAVTVAVVDAECLELRAPDVAQHGVDALLLCGGRHALLDPFEITEWCRDHVTMRRLGETRCGIEVLRHGHGAGIECGADAVREHALFEGVELHEGCIERVLRLGIETEAVIAGAIGVRVHVVGAGVARQRDRRLGMVEQMAFGAGGVAATDAYTHRNQPLRVGGEAGADRRVTRLLHGQRGLAVLAGQGRVEQRHAGLVGEAGEGLAQHVRVVALRRQRVAEVDAGGRAERELAHVRTQRGAEFVLAEIAFHHRQHRAALLVGDAVEGAADLGPVLDRVVDASCGREAVRTHGAETAAEQIHVGFEFRIDLVHDLGRDPGREGFVQPDVVPPRHRH